MKDLKGYDLIIEAGKTEKHYWKDVWLYRELLFFLSWRDVLVRYKQTFIGIAWSIIRPLLTMLVFTIIFGKLAKLPSGGVPYPVLVLSAMLAWQFFSSSLSESSSSLINNSNLVSKVYFPRVIFPASAILVSFVDFVISFILLLVFMFWYKTVPNMKILLLPFFILMVFITALGIGLWFSSMNVKYRDFRYIVPFFVQFGLYISPVGFLSSIVPEKWRLIYSLNPMVGVIDGFRWCLLNSQEGLFLPGFFCSLLISLFLFISGLWFFRKTERTFADVI